MLPFEIKMCPLYRGGFICGRRRGTRIGAYVSGGVRGRMGEHAGVALLEIQIYTFVRSFIRIIVHSYNRSFVHSFIRSRVHSFTRIIVHSFTRVIVQLFSRSFVSFVRSVHSFKSSEHTKGDWTTSV